MRSVKPFGADLRRMLALIVVAAISFTALLMAISTSAQDGDSDKHISGHKLNPFTDPNMPTHIDARLAVNAQNVISDPSPMQQKALRSLEQKLGTDAKLSVIYSPLTNSPARISNPKGYLSEPSTELPETIARNFISQYAGAFRLGQQDIDTLRLRSRATTQEGTTIMVFQQTVEGVPVFQGEVMVNVAKSGQIVNVGGLSYPQIGMSDGFSLTAGQAVQNATTSMNVAYDLQPTGESDVLSTYGDLKPQYVRAESFAPNGGVSDEIKVQRIIFPVGTEGRPAYKFVISTPQYYGIMWQVIVDAASGETLQRLSLTAFQNHPGGGVNNNRLGSFRPDIQNMVETYYQPGGSAGRIVDTAPATLSGVGGVGRATRTGTPGSYIYSQPTYLAEASDTNRFRYSIINARNENPNYFNGSGVQTFTEAAFPAVMGQVIRGLPSAASPTAGSPFGWFYLPTGTNGSEIAVGDTNRAATRVSGYTMAAEAQTRNLAENSPSGSGAQPFSADVTTIGTPVTLADGRVLNSVIQSRYTEGNNVSVSDDRENDDNSTSGIKGYSPIRSYTDPRFLYTASYEFGGVDATGGGTGGGTVTYPASANQDIYPGTVSLFYFNNVSHDYLYTIGFTESMWNFQFDNFGKGGAGGDAIFAEVQDGSGTDNANMGTPDDGSSPRMQMYLFTDGGFRRSDGDFDWDVIAHEQYHGVSNRSAGKGLTSCLGTPLVGEAGCMGEGWSDFIASSMADDDNEGEYLTGDLDRGIRRLPLTNYRWSYGSIANGTLNVRKNTNTDIVAPDPNVGGIPYEVHDIGEVWAGVLWSMRELMIVKQRVNNAYPGIFFDGTRRSGGGTTFYIGDRPYQSVDTFHPINYRSSFATDGPSSTPVFPNVPKINASDIVRPGAVAAEIASGNYSRRSGPIATSVANGARLADKITLRGLQLAPCNPTFVDMRDSMIAADREITGGENVAVIWRAFTSHGVGQNATSANSGTGASGPVVEDFTIPTTVSACETSGPIAPPTFTLSNTASNTVTVTITAAPGAADYVIQRSTSANGPFATIATQAGTTYSDTAVNSGFTYYYQVHARRNADCVGRANTQNITVTIGTAPVVSPVFFGADSVSDPQTGSSLTVNWSPATSANPTASIVYDVYRVNNVGLDNDLVAPTFAPSTANRIAQGVSATSLTDIGLTTGQQYYYIVRARDTNNNQLDTGNVGNTKSVVGAPFTATPNAQIFALETFEAGTANARFTPSLTNSTTPNTGQPVFQRVPNVLMGPSNSSVMYAPDFDPADSGQGAPSNFATLIGPLTLSRGSVLEFDHRYTTEATFDGGVIEIVLGAPTSDPIDATPFPNNSTTFDLNDYIIQGAYNGALNGMIEGAAIGSPLQGRRAWNGTGSFQHVRAALGDFAAGGTRNTTGLPVYVRFHSSSDVGTNAGIGSGWFIDNLVVNNFDTAAATVILSGTITSGGSPLPGVSVALSGTTSSSTTTDSNGQYSFNATSGDYLVTPTLSGYTFEPESRSYASIATNVTNANFTALATGTNPRNLTVGNAYAVPTQSVSVPVSLTSQGNEASLTFSLTYDSAILSNPSVTCGADSGSGCSLTVNTSTIGRIGVSVDPTSTTYAAGSREVIRVAFNTAATTAANTPVGFSDTPAPREVSDPNANPLPTGYIGGYVIFARGIEADVTARPNGDGAVSSTDVAQIRRFAVGLDSYDVTTNEFQRADCAPYATQGNGSVAATDVTQARRYQIGSDPSQPAAGPAGPSSFAPVIETETKSPSAENIAAPRKVRVVSVNGNRNQQVNVLLHVDSVGDENNYGFSINYNSAVLSNPLVTIGPDATGGNVLANTTTMPGRIGFSVDFGSGTMPVGTNLRLVNIRFNIAADAPYGNSNLVFADAPAIRETSNTTAQALPTDYEDGFVNIMAPTSANAIVGGRVFDTEGDPLGRATITITNGAGQSASARTNGFGYYRFEGVQVGETYVLSVIHKLYSYTPRTVTVGDSINDMDFHPSN